MANFKRKKAKRQVRCTMCTQHRWLGNNKGRYRHTDNRAKEKALDMMKDI